MTILPPDPYTMKAVETATKTSIELIHNDIKEGLKEFFRLARKQSKEQAVRNVASFEHAFEDDLTRRISIGLEEDRYKRITVSASDPDFTYLIRQATISSARTNSTDKHKLLARAVTERLLAKPEGLVALASSLACETIPNLTPNQLKLLGLASSVYALEPDIPVKFAEENSEETLQSVYIKAKLRELEIFLPFPRISALGYLHLEGMSCISYNYLSNTPLERVLSPRNMNAFYLKAFKWPDNIFIENTTLKELQSVWDDGLTHCRPTTVGQIIGIHVRDIKSDLPPTNLYGYWDEQ